MLATSTCPSDKALRDYLVGQLSDSESSLIEQHLRDCRCCEELVDKLYSPAIAKDEPDALLRFLPQVGATERKQRDNLADCESSENSDEPQVDDSWADIANRKLSSYELVQRIGTGGMGMVYRARHRSLDKWVAVKLLPARRAADGAAIGRFQREMRLVGRLNHPAIVSATDAGLDGETHFLVMELIDGLDLSRVIRSIGTIAPADAAEIGRQVALGLDHAHAQGVIHRDIKPSNLMLDGQGQVKLLDLGLADLCPWCQPVDDWTTVGQLLGTLDYMAPEQADGQRGVTHRSDLYSLGATLFRLVAGRPPLAPTPDGSPLEKLRLLATERPPAVRTLRPELPIELARIIDLLLDRDPARRPTSAAAVAEQLEPLAASADLRSLIDAARKKLRDPAGDPVLGEMDEHHGVPDWPPNVELAAAPEPRAAVPGNQLSGWMRGGWRTLAALLTAAGGAIVLGTILIVLETMQGQLVIETDQADLRVQVVSDGEPVRHLELQPGANSTRLRADKYEILIDQPVDRTVMIENGSFELRRGETVIARIRSQPRGGVVSPSAATDPVSRDSRELVYEGRTTDEWIDVLKLERSAAKIPTDEWIDDPRLERPAAKIQHAMRALISLRPQDSQEEIVELVLEAVRRHGMYALIHPETPDGAPLEIVQQLLAIVSSPAELVERLLRDMAESRDPRVSSYSELIIHLHPYIDSDAGLIQVSGRLLEVMPVVSQRQSHLVAALGSRLAKQLAPKHEELAEQVLYATFQAFREYDGLLFGRFPRTDQEHDALPAVWRRYIIADYLRVAFEKRHNAQPSRWIPLVEAIFREPENIVHLDRLLPNFRQRLLDQIKQVLAAPDQRSARFIDLNKTNVSLFKPEGFQRELTRLSLAGLGSKIELAPHDFRKFDSFHYLLTVLVRLDVTDEVVLEWLLERQAELKESHDLAIELVPIMTQFQDAVFDKIPKSSLWDDKKAGMIPGFRTLVYQPSPLSYVTFLSNADRWDLIFDTKRSDWPSRQSKFVAWLKEVDIEPLDPDIPYTFLENLIGYWDYILITGAIQLLTGGEDAAEVRETSEASEQDSAAGTPLPSAKSDAVYEGRTARQWMDELRRERSVGKIQEGMTALLALQPKDSEEEIVELVLEAVRRHGMETLSRNPDGDRRSPGGSQASLTIVEQLVSSVTSPRELSQRLLRDMAEATELNVARYAGLVESLAGSSGRFMTVEDLEVVAETYLEVLPHLSQSPELVGSLARKLAERLASHQEPLAKNVLDATFQRFGDHREPIFGKLPSNQRERDNLPLVLRRYVIADHFRHIPEQRRLNPDPSVMEFLLVLDFLEEHPEEAESLRQLVPGFLAHVLERAWGITDDFEDERERQMAIRQVMVTSNWRPRHRDRDVSKTLEHLAELATASGLDVEFGPTGSPRDPINLRHHALLIAVKVAPADEELLGWLRAKQEQTKVAYDGYVEFMNVVGAREEKNSATLPDSDRPSQFKSAVSRFGQYDALLLNLEIFERAGRQPAPQADDEIEGTAIKPIPPELWKAAGGNLLGYWDYILITGALNSER